MRKVVHYIINDDVQFKVLSQEIADEFDATLVYARMIGLNVKAGFGARESEFIQFGDKIRVELAIHPSQELLFGFDVFNLEGYYETKVGSYRYSVDSMVEGIKKIRELI